MLVLSAAAWKCAARDRWIGWDRRYQFDRLHLIANNARFLILPQWHAPNLASRVLGLCEQRVGADWQARFGYPLWLLETFVDPRRFTGTCYRAANWLEVGQTRGYRRTRAGYSDRPDGAKLVFVRPLIAHAQARLAHPRLDPLYHYRRKSARARKGNPYVRRILCEAAHAASRTRYALAEKFKVLLVRRGRKRAIFALAHKILKIVFVLIHRGDYYRDATVNYEAISVERNAPRWIRMLRKYHYIPA
ncbi:hypothetical protein Thiosp_03717 [Thiorhodovibrio litoralis]|nr:hypothetical protein Thiosp_03717 [Thiorhodovibrio litoralis]